MFCNEGIKTHYSKSIWILFAIQFRFTVFFEPLTQRSQTEVSRKYVKTIAKCTLPQLQLSSERYSIARPISCHRPSNPPSECTEWIFSLSLQWNIMGVSMPSSPPLPHKVGPGGHPPPISLAQSFLTPSPTPFYFLAPPQPVFLLNHQDDHQS